MTVFQVFVKAAGAPSVRAVTVDSSEIIENVVQKYAKAAGMQYMGNTNVEACLSWHDAAAHTFSRRSQLPPCVLLEILPRLCGGGGDGGSTGAESRSAYLAMYKGKQYDKVNPEEERLAKWTACRLSGMPLQPPCAADELGNLFNKEAVVQALLAKNVPKTLAHITSMKHLVDVKLEESQGTAADAAVKFACPVTGLPMSGKSKFVLIRPSGKGLAYVVSERAIKELPMVVKEIVGGDWAPEDVYSIYPQGEELEQRQAIVTARREAELNAKLEKKAAKAAAKNGNKRNTTTDASNGALEAATGANGAAEPSAKRPKSGTAAEELMPARADPKVWNSIFAKKEEKLQGSKGNTDYMVRAGLKYTT